MAKSSSLFNFPTFTSPAPSPAPAAGAPVDSQSPPPQNDAPPPPPPRVRNDNPRTTSAGFDPEPLERGAEAVEKIAKSKEPKKVSTFFVDLVF